MDREGGPLPRRALDRQPAAMTVEDVLDQRQAEPGAALGAAFRDVDAIEALGQARQMLWRDAGAAVAHRDARLAFAVRSFADRQRDVHALAGGGIFERVLHQVLEHPDQLIAVADSLQTLARDRNVEVNAAGAGGGAELRMVLPSTLRSRAKVCRLSATCRTMAPTS